jgi:orotate phosphoribosyltransferase
VRKKPKQHGDEAEVEGIVQSPVVIVDDVITRGYDWDGIIGCIEVLSDVSLGLLS